MNAKEIHAIVEKIRSYYRPPGPPALCFSLSNDEAEAVIFDAFAEQESEIARLREALDCDYASFDDLLDWVSEFSDARQIIAGAKAMNRSALLPPAEPKEVKP